MQPVPRKALVLSILLGLGACSGGGGGGGSTDPQIPASVPAGAGVTVIDMTGTWEIRDSVVVETNSPFATPPLNGTAYVIEPGRIASFQGLSVAPADLGVLAGTPLSTYVNLVDGRKLFFSFSYDSRATGGQSFQLAVAGGAVDADTMLVEHYESVQLNRQAAAFFTRSTYRLVRIAGAPTQLDPASAEAAAEFDRLILRR